MEFDDEKRLEKAGRRQQRLAEKAQRDTEAVAAVVRTLLQHPNGRVFLWQLLVRCGVYRSSFTGNSTTFFNEGRRDIGLLLLDWILDADPAGYATMATENRVKDEGSDADQDDSED